MNGPTRPNSGLATRPCTKQKPEIARIESIVFTRADCTRAWKIFSDWNLWHKFSNVYATSIEWQGPPWEAGSRMMIDIVRPLAAKVDRVITISNPPRCVAWINHVCGYTMEQWVVFDPHAGGGTKISTWIELTGPAMCHDGHDVKTLVEDFTDEWFHNFSLECNRMANRY